MKTLFVILFSLVSAYTLPQSIQKEILRPREIQRPGEIRSKIAAVPVQVDLFVRKTPSREAGWFTTIKDAIDSAAANNYRMIRVIVYPGTYTEPLRITRPTKIEAPDKGVILSGSISNNEGHNLTLSGITMRDCRRFSLIQRGGALNLTDFGIYRTRRSAADSDSGVALDIGGGSVGRFTNVTLNDNGGPALRIHGSSTKILVQRLTVRNNQINRGIIESTPSDRWSEHIAAVEVADGALLLGNNPVIENNEFIGLLARNGGRVHLRAGRVTNTKSIDYDSRKWGGINVSARTGSRIELRNMQISDARLAGIQNSSSWFKTSDSQVIRNVIGAHVKGLVDPDYNPVACLANYRTIFDDNDRNLDSEYLPVPGTGLDDEKSPSCPGVPWEF